MVGHVDTCLKPANGTEEVILLVEQNEASPNSVPSETRENSDDENKAELVKKGNTCTFKAWTQKNVLILFLVLLCIVLVVTVIYLPTKQYPCVPPCPQGWAGLEPWCYYLSTTEATWNESQSNCSSYGGSLTAIDTEKELDFLLDEKQAAGYWIGLRREEEQPWKWANGTAFNPWFNIGPGGQCAYLHDGIVSSSWCTNERNWICRKPHLSA